MTTYCHPQVVLCRMLDAIDSARAMHAMAIAVVKTKIRTPFILLSLSSGYGIGQHLHRDL